MTRNLEGKKRDIFGYFISCKNFYFVLHSITLGLVEFCLHYESSFNNFRFGQDLLSLLNVGRELKMLSKLS